jgi:predicted metal-dependent HD superfamily phosphohydrolase
MFEEIFRYEVLIFKPDDLQIKGLWTEIEEHYNKPSRYYHNIAHLNYLVEQLQVVKSRIGDWLVILFSVAYHDIIYDTTRKDNEECSAGLAEKRLDELGLSPERIERCRNQILATKHHLPSNDPDENYFLDADLSILGTEENTYMDYTRKIRKEYSHLPDLMYKAGRRDVLTRFLSMDFIFKTSYFKCKFEDQARRNILKELKQLY